MTAASTYWMHTNDRGNLELSSVPPEDGKLYLAVTPEFLRRMPITLCEAPSGGATNKNTYYIKGDISDIYAQGTNTGLTVMMFIAAQNSVDGDGAKICFVPSNIEYTLKTISDQGFERDIGEGDIIANKVCFIRYNPITGNILLINPSIDKEAMVSTLKVFNSAEFNNMPKVKKLVQDSEGNYTTEYEDLVPISLVKELETRLEKLERRFIIGVVEPQDALQDAEDGTIYMKIGDILT